MTRAHDDAAQDDLLMERIQRDESVEAFCQLYARFHLASRDLAVAICGEALADAVIREAFASLWNRRDGYRIAGGVVADWVRAIVEVRAREAAHDPRAVTETADRPAELRPLETGDGVAAVARAEGRRVEARRIGTVMDALPEPQRKVIALAFYGGLSHTEIADQLGLPMDAVTGRMRLGLRQLLDENEQKRA